MKINADGGEPDFCRVITTALEETEHFSRIVVKVDMYFSDRDSVSVPDLKYMGHAMTGPIAHILLLNLI